RARARDPADVYVATPLPLLRHVLDHPTGRSGPPEHGRPAAQGQPRGPALIMPRGQNRPGAGPCECGVGVAVRSPPRAYPAQLPGLRGRDWPCGAARGRAPGQWWAADQWRWRRSSTHPTWPELCPTRRVLTSGQASVTYRDRASRMATGAAGGLVANLDGASDARSRQETSVAGLWAQPGIGGAGSEQPPVPSVHHVLRALGRAD